MKQYDMIIIGAGPAGMSAAYAAAKEGIRILLLEKADRIGKKILVTGNGRCNLTNEVQNPDCYRSDYGERVQGVLSSFSYEDTHIFFRNLGILTRNKNGYIYPYNEQAASVREAFEVALTSQENITILTGCKVEGIDFTKKGYRVFTNRESFGAKAVVVATGGYAGPSIGCDGSGFAFAKAMGHEIVKPFPALTPLKSGAPFLKKVSGVRNQARIHLLVDGVEERREEGELQWTEYGISGVAIFQLSRYAVLAMEEGKKVALSLDFMPDWKEEDVEALLTSFQKKCSYKNLKELISGFLPGKLVPVVLREAKIKEEKSVMEIKEEDIHMLCHSIKHFLLRINGYVGYEKAQVTRGGVSLRELNDQMESIYQPGLFFAGEVTDVDGTCGGYNLQWAFSSGNLAGLAAASYVSTQKKEKGKRDHA
ncbi:MAG: NAD(P)/FAD-dependent oxidoreductase [Eubacteriales bacterium]|nr:NAD(P)/FAD-dependent oxidoreductase [Eubacteriales bacterium]